MRLLFDLESDGLLDTVTQVWCAVVKDLDTGKKWQFGPDQIPQLLTLLRKATTLYGHYIAFYDLPVLKLLYEFVPEASVKIVDTVIWSKIAYSDLERNDYEHMAVGRLSAKGLIGAHSLEAWGIRLGNLKGDYGKREEAWAAYSLDMLLYCAQDVDVNSDLIDHLEKSRISQEVIQMEMEFALISERMSSRGFRFDSEKAERLCAEIEEKQREVNRRLQTVFDPEIETGKRPRCYRVQWPDGSISKFDTKGEADTERKARKLKPKDVTIKKGPPCKTLLLFNPNSRKQVREKLFERYGWLSPELTDKGQELLSDGHTHKQLATDYGVISEDTLSTLDYPEAKDLIAYMMCSKRISQIRDGDGGWLKKVENGRIHHRMDTIGCATFRCAHSGPNLGQVPSVEIDPKTKQALHGFEGGWGYDCRDLFIPSEGMVQVGVDMAGIEARLLAHFLSPYDKGAYIDQVLNGDVHALNVDAIKQYVGFIVGRNDFKSSFYGYLYGAGAAKMGLQLVGICQAARDEFVELNSRNLNQQIQIQDQKTRKKRTVWGGDYPADAARLAYSVLGVRVKKALEVGITGLGDLIAAIKQRAERGYLTPMDGRRVPVRTQHAALNSLLQSSAAIVMKRWVINTERFVSLNSVKAGLLAVIHDECQFECDPNDTSRLADGCIEAIKSAGRFYRLAIPLDGEAKIGRSWAECH